jgi:DNA-binding NarL/FixJ family response regulator
MNSRLDIEKFDKILALASSDRDGEALAALRKARAMLSEAGLSFRDIAQAPKSVPAAANRQPQERPSEHLGLKVVILEKALNAARAEVLKWNQAARTATAERETATAGLAARIAELERDLAAAAAAAAQPKVEPSPSEKRRTVLALLRDPATGGLSNREIARRAGVAPQTVCNWRNRLGTAFGAETAPQRLVTRAGRTYRMNTRRIGKRVKAR